MAGEIVNSSGANDQEKFIAARLIQRSMLRLVAASICDKVEQPNGAGTVAYFVRYRRMNVPQVTLTETVDPANSSMTIDQYSVTLDQWGDIITLSDIVQLTVKHPILQQAIDLLADNAQRVIDREVQVVWLAGTNVTYGDGTVTARRSITAAMKVSDTVVHKARVTLIDQGAPTRNGPSQPVQVKSADGASSINGGSAYVAVCGPQVMADLMQSGTSLGTWASVATYGDRMKLYNAEVGTWLGIRWVESNFVPKFVILGDTTVAVASGAAFGTGTPIVTAIDGGGTLISAATYFYKVTRKELTRGFEEEISIEHTTAAAATGNNESFSFAFPAGVNYVYNLYFGSASGDANLKLVQANIAAGATVVVTAVPGANTTAPDNVNPTGTPTIHPVFIHGAESCSWVGLQNLQTFVTKDESIIGNVLKLKRAVGYKFMGKAIIRDQTRMLRLEVASTY